jgi:hypothetical protein
MSRRLVLALVIVTLLVSAYAVLAAPSQQSAAEITSIEVEVAEDGNRFVFGQERLFGDGMPQYGSPFVTQGYIYPKGTLNGSNGVLADGTAEFPDLVIGEWTCFGWMIGDGAHTTTGAWVVSTQVYTLNEEFGNAQIVTDGFELADIDVASARAITGGTGVYANAGGEQMQSLLGFTEQMGVNLSVEFKLQNVEMP